MKILSPFFFGSLLLLFTATCNNTGNQAGDEYTGTIEQQGMTSYQYGTHVLNTEDSFYALKSESIDLDRFIGEKVTVKAEKVEGYPVDGGPEYLQVTEVKQTRK